MTEDEKCSILEAELDRLLEFRRDYGAFILAGLTAFLTLLPLAGKEGGILNTNPAYWTLIPLLPLGVLAYAVRQTRRVIVMQYYARAIENELRTVSRTPVLHGSDQFGGHRLAIPSLFSLDTASLSSRHGDPTLAFAGAIYNFALFASVLAVVIIAMTKVGHPLIRAVLSVTYGAGFVALVVIYFDSVWNGRELWRRLTTTVTDGYGTARAKLSRRVAYLVLPRPRALLFKGTLFFAFPPILVSATPGFPSLDFGNLLLGWVLFEFLIMQGRYIVNDVVGWGADADDHDGRHVRAANLFLSRAGSSRLLGIYGLSRAALGISIALTGLSEGALEIGLLGFAALMVMIFYEAARHWLPRTSPLVVSTVFVGYFPRVMAGMISGGLALSSETVAFSLLLCAAATALVLSAWQDRYAEVKRWHLRWHRLSIGIIGAACAAIYAYLAGNSGLVSVGWALATSVVFVLARTSDPLRAWILPVSLVFLGALMWEISGAALSVLPLTYANFIVAGWFLASQKEMPHLGEERRA